MICGASTLPKNSPAALGGLSKSFSMFWPAVVHQEVEFWPCVSEEDIRCACELPWQPGTFFLFNDTFRLACISAKYRLLKGGNWLSAGQLNLEARLNRLLQGYLRFLSIMLNNENKQKLKVPGGCTEPGKRNIIKGLKVKPSLVVHLFSLRPGLKSNNRHDALMYIIEV